MPLIPYVELLPEFMAEVKGCPNPIAKRAFRSSAIAFCRESESYIYVSDPLTTVAGMPELEFDTPEDTRVSKVLSLTFDGRKLEPTSELMLDNRIPDWRERVGAPQVFFKLPGDRARLSPTPEKTEPQSVTATLALVPLRQSDGIEEDYIEEHLEAIIHGTLNRLMSMRDQPWFNPQLASAHGMQFQEAILQAKRTGRGDNYAKIRTTTYGGY